MLNVNQRRLVAFFNNFFKDLNAKKCIFDFFLLVISGWSYLASNFNEKMHQVTIRFKRINRNTKRIFRFDIVEWWFVYHHELIFERRCVSELSNFSLFLETVHDAATRGLSFIPHFADDESTNILAKQLIDKICNVNKAATEIGWVERMEYYIMKYWNQIILFFTFRNVLGMYKEFCYLVTSLKNYSIIYHFLNLLNHDNQKSDEVSILVFIRRDIYLYRKLLLKYFIFSCSQKYLFILI